MKQQKTTKILGMILLVLIIVLISAVSFLGILRQDLNSWNNIIPDYELGRELNKMRVLTFSVDTATETQEVEEENAEEGEETSETTDETSVEVNQTVSDDEEISVSPEEENSEEAGSEGEETEPNTVEVPVNKPEVLTKDNYTKTKEILESRFAKAEITDSEIVVDYENGDLNIYVPFNDVADRVVDYVTAQGKIELIDTESGDLLMSNNMISSVTAYSTLSEQQDTEETAGITYDLGLQFNLTDEGVNKLNELSKIYIETKNEDGEATQKTLDVQIDGQTVYQTYFDPNGSYTDLIIPIYSGVTESQYETYVESINIYENTINTGLIPIKYIANYTTYLENNTNMTAILVAVVVFAIITAIISIYLIVKYKSKGLLAMLSQIGYIATVLLIIRFAKETITVFSMISIFAITLINYAFIIKLMNEKSDSFIQSLIQYTLKLMPVVIVALVFVFATSVELRAVGAALFWGLLGLVVYNLIFTNNLFNIHRKLKKMGGNK